MILALPQRTQTRILRTVLFIAGLLTIAAATAVATRCEGPGEVAPQKRGTPASEG